VDRQEFNMEMNELEKQATSFLANDDTYNFAVKFITASIEKAKKKVLDSLRGEYSEQIRYRVLGELDSYERILGYLLKWKSGYTTKESKEETNG
jgi:hypothetical protein